MPCRKRRKVASFTIGHLMIAAFLPLSLATFSLGGTSTGETTAASRTQQAVESGKKTIIRASLDQFKDSPIMANSQVRIKERPDRREHHFTNASLTGQNNAIIFYDDKKDGSIDRIVMILPFDSGNELATLESFTLAMRITQVASGQDGSKGFAQEFLRWLGSSVKEATLSPVSKWFGDVLVGLGVLRATDGFVALVTIGEDNIPRKGQKEL